MDAEHRHELKTNELADGLSHLPKLIKDNANTIIGVIIIAAALITWPMFNKASHNKAIVEQTEASMKIQMLDQDIYKVLSAPAEDPLAKGEALNTLLVNAETLLDEASEIDKPNLSALAQIKAAQAIRTYLHMRPEVQAQELEEQVQKAKNAYENAFKIADNATLKGMALFGQGLCDEELGQTDQAKDIYAQIIAEETYQPTVFPTQAQQRLDNLEENIEVFNFAEVPVAVEEAVDVPVLDTEAVDVPVEAATEEPADQEPSEEVTEVPATEAITTENTETIKEQASDSTE